MRITTDALEVSPSPASPPVCLHKGDLFEGRGSVLVHHLVKREQRVEHALDVTLAKVQPARLLKALRMGRTPVRVRVTNY